MTTDADTKTSNAPVFWFTGMSGAGKSTIAEGVSEGLTKAGRRVLTLDGDDVRARLHRNLGFSEADIKENNSLMVGLCQTHRKDHDAILVPIISPYASSRKDARDRLSPGFFEIYCHAELGVLTERDTKGLYAKAQRGEMDNLIGYSPGAPYEVPKAPDLAIATAKTAPEDAIEKMLAFVTARLR